MVAQRSLHEEQPEEEVAEKGLPWSSTVVVSTAAGGEIAGGAYQRWGKRAFDLALGVPLLLIATPVVLMLALAIVATSGWPPFYTARRLGKDGREFSMLKLRSMVRDADRALQEWEREHPELAAEYARNFKLKNDPRVTPLGRFLRRTSLDELPQLWNVLRGEMSLVGPRPIVGEELANYGANAPVFLSHRPGMTGLWAISGRSKVEYPQRTWFELTYCRSVSVATDLRILAQTAHIVLRLNGL